MFKKNSKSTRITRRFYVVIGLLMAFSLIITSQSALSSITKKPDKQSQKTLDKYPSYTEAINIIEPNKGNGLHSFLKKNVSKTIYLDFSMLRYNQIPQGKKPLAPTDRFENVVVQKCWGKDIDNYGNLESGDTGFPLPIDDKDINAGCKYRIKINTTDGDAHPNLNFMYGEDKFEILFDGFFEVTKQDLPNTTTLYVLNETVEIPEETINVFQTHKKVKDRKLRRVWVDAPKQPKKK